MIHTVQEQTRRWLEDAVIALNLCPFANRVVQDKTLRIAVSTSTDLDEAFRFTLSEAQLLLESPPEQISTTLAVLPNVLKSFEAFWQFTAEIEGALDAAGATGTLQIATFHPDYRFDGVDPNDPSNYTNRAPHPTVHLIREQQLAEAIATYNNPENIPERNIQVMRDLGIEGILALWKNWHGPSK